MEKQPIEEFERLLNSARTLWREMSRLYEITNDLMLVSALYHQQLAIEALERHINGMNTDNQNETNSEKNDQFLEDAIRKGYVLHPGTLATREKAQWVLNSDVLPARLLHETLLEGRDEVEEWKNELCETEKRRIMESGVIFGDHVDADYIYAVLPSGWSKRLIGADGLIGVYDIENKQRFQLNVYPKRPYMFIPREELDDILSKKSDKSPIIEIRNKDHEVVGTVDITADGLLTVTGKVDESARIFFEYFINRFSDYIDERFGKEEQPMSLDVYLRHPITGKD